MRGARKAPILHLALDQGAVGFQAALWFLNGLGIRGTASFDLCHRVQNDILGATTAAGLMLPIGQFCVERP